MSNSVLDEYQIEMGRQQLVVPVFNLNIYISFCFFSHGIIPLPYVSQLHIEILTLAHLGQKVVHPRGHPEDTSM